MFIASLLTAKFILSESIINNQQAVGYHEDLYTIYKHKIGFDALNHTIDNQQAVGCRKDLYTQCTESHNGTKTIINSMNQDIIATTQFQNGDRQY